MPVYWFKRVPNMGFRATSRKLEQARDSIGSVRYIPGLVEGDAVPMRLYESGILSDDSRLGAGPYPQNNCDRLD